MKGGTGQHIKRVAARHRPSVVRRLATRSRTKQHKATKRDTNMHIREGEKQDRQKRMSTRTHKHTLQVRKRRAPSNHNRVHNTEAQDMSHEAQANKYQQDARLEVFL